MLGVSRDNVLKEVKKAYFHKAKKYHPDLNPGDDTAKLMFLKIQSAYRSIENELDPTLKSVRDSQFREYETTARDGKPFTSKRGTKTKEEEEKEGKGKGGDWKGNSKAFMGRDSSTNYDY